MLTAFSGILRIFFSFSFSLTKKKQKVKAIRQLLFFPRQPSQETE
jgi:hypothetical protein